MGFGLGLCEGFNEMVGEVVGLRDGLALRITNEGVVVGKRVVVVVVVAVVGR